MHVSNASRVSGTELRDAFSLCYFFFRPVSTLLPVVVQPNQLVVGLLPLLPVVLVWASDADRHCNILHFMNNSKELLLLVIALS